MLQEKPTHGAPGISTHSPHWGLRAPRALLAMGSVEVSTLFSFIST